MSSIYKDIDFDKRFKRLIHETAPKYGFSKEQGEQIIKEYEKAIADAIRKRKTVRIPEFGLFKPIKQQQYEYYIKKRKENLLETHPEFSPFGEKSDV